MKKFIYAGIALIGSALTSLGFAHEQVKTQDTISLSNDNFPSQIINKKNKPFVFSDLFKNNKTFTLAGHYSHMSHRSHYSHSSHRSGY